jgi:hypothetical protein
MVLKESVMRDVEETCSKLLTPDIGSSAGGKELAERVHVLTTTRDDTYSHINSVKLTLQQMLDDVNTFTGI